MTSRRRFLTTAGIGTAAALAAPAVRAAQPKIKWRLQTYAGPALAEQVITPMVKKFNAIAGDEMQIELYTSDQLVPTGELFRAMQAGTIDAVHSDDDSMASPVEVGLFGGYFPFATRSILDVPVLFQQYGLGDIWREAYSGTGVVWLSAAGQDPCNFNTKKEITSVADLDGLKLYTFPTAGRFLTQFGVVPLSIPYEDAEVAVQTGELDGMSWSGITEDYTVGWANVTDYFLTNNISGAWIGSWFANEEKWNELPDHLKALYMSCMEASHTFRNQWYWGGEAKLRATGDKLKLRSVPAKDWKQVEDAAIKFWDEIGAESETKAKVISIFKDYNKVINGAGFPYGES
jgi:TRAP-type mannitol/chloroaromatic compound transport system substrate-binding protein